MTRTGIKISFIEVDYHKDIRINSSSTFGYRHLSAPYQMNSWIPCILAEAVQKVNKQDFFAT